MHTPEEIVAKLRQVDVLLSQGRSVGEAVRTIGVTQFPTTSAWFGASNAGEIFTSMQVCYITTQGRES